MIVTITKGGEKVVSSEFRDPFNASLKCRGVVVVVVVVMVEGP